MGGSLLQPSLTALWDIHSLHLHGKHPSYSLVEESLPTSLWEAPDLQPCERITPYISMGSTRLTVLWKNHSLRLYGKHPSYSLVEESLPTSLCEVPVLQSCGRITPYISMGSTRLTVLWKNHSLHLYGKYPSYSLVGDSLSTTLEETHVLLNIKNKWFPFGLRYAYSTQSFLGLTEELWSVQCNGYMKVNLEDKL